LAEPKKVRQGPGKGSTEPGEPERARLSLESSDRDIGGLDRVSGGGGAQIWREGKGKRKRRQWLGFWML